MIHEYGNIIDGSERGGAAWGEVYNPYDGRLVGRVASATKETTLAVIKKMRESKRPASTRHERSGILQRMAEGITADAEFVSKLISAESGLCLKDTLYEASRVCDVLRFASIKALDDDSQVFPCDVTQNGRARRIYTTRYPLNLIVAITPYNHPMNQVAHKIAPAIATNNKVILKPAAKTPLSAYYLAKLALRCGLPPDMISVLTGKHDEVIHPLVRSESTELITFTGSSRVGKDIATHAGYKRLILELGGGSAMLVLQDADVDEAVDITVTGTFKNSGQRCTAIRRLVVHESIANAFAKKLTEKTALLKYGDPNDPATDVGTVIDEAAAGEMQERVDDAVKRGAKLLLGNERQGALYSPTVLDHVKNDFPLVANETFGPIAPIIRFNTLDDAIHIANENPYGLSGAVMSNHWPSIQRVISEVETGTVNVNEAPSYRLEWSPFGGVKGSGLGYKEGIIEAMKGMTNLKTYSLPWDTP